MRACASAFGNRRIDRHAHTHTIAENRASPRFPSNIIAGLFHFTPEEFFEIEDVGIRSAPQVSL